MIRDNKNEFCAYSTQGDVASMKEYIFISYKSEEKHIADKMKHILEENSIACWMAPESIPGGADYAAEITPAIGNCKAFLVILSSLSQNSPHVRREIDLAIKKNKRILPFVVEDFVFNNSIDYYFTNVQLYPAYLSWESELEKLIREIRYDFTSIDVRRSPNTVLQDPVKIASALPHVFDKGYVLFARYQIEALLQVCSGNQQHYSALDLHTKKQVLVKYIDRTLPYSDPFFDTSTAGTLFQHPYIAAPMDEYSNESYFIHIEPFYEVKSLSTIIHQSGRQSPEEVLKWSVAVCHAMIYLNEEMGYGYCYMSPQNIRLQRNGIPLLFDVNTAAPLSTCAPGFILDPEYSPPELFRSQCPVTPQIDIYSLGANMFYALTGIPFQLDFLFFSADPIGAQESIPKCYQNILRRCLHIRPEKRYQSFRDLLSDLEDIASPGKKTSGTSIFRKLFPKRG